MHIPDKTIPNKHNYEICLRPEIHHGYPGIFRRLFLCNRTYAFSEGLFFAV